MFDLDRWKEIWETIARNRKRSIMTGLGVFWGIFMFTVMMGFGMWLGRTALSSLGSYSTNTTYFFTDQTSVGLRNTANESGTAVAVASRTWLTTSMTATPRTSPT